LLAGFVGLFLVLVGLTLLAPAGTVLLMRLLTPIAGALFGGLGRMATRGVTTALSRTAIAVAALMMAVSVTVGVDIMIGSFRGTVETWLRQVLPADLYVTTPGVVTDRFASAAAALEPELLASLDALPGVDRVDTVRHAGVASTLGRVRLLAYDLGSRGRDAFVFKRGDADRAWQAVAAGNATIVTEPFAARHDLELGDRFEIRTPTGPLDLEIAGIVFDYATEEGRFIVDQRLYSHLWADDNRTAASVWLASGADRDEIRRNIARLGGAGAEVTVRSNGELRDESLAVFDRTFVVTGVLRLLAVVVAFIAVLSALTALQLERARELALLRASGLTPAQVWTVVTSQTGLMGLTAGLFSLPVGLTMAFILVHVINRRSFGWTLETTIEPRALLLAMALAFGAALIAGLYPAWRMARVPPAEALRGE
jgi:putative ABC transport system permease protein